MSVSRLKIKGRLPNHVRQLDLDDPDTRVLVTKLKMHAQGTVEDPYLVDCLNEVIGLLDRNGEQTQQKLYTVA